MSRFPRNMVLLAALTLMAVITAPVAVRAQDEAAFELGKQIFTTDAEPQCAVCHTLADAGAAGEIGPDLDELKPSLEKVRLAVKGGLGVMPPYEGLTDEQIEAVALYVSSVAGAAD